MKITKYLHSCVLVEEGDDAILFDPGIFSFMDERVAPELFAHVRLIVVTHNHPDHYDAEVIRRIAELSGAAVLTTEEVAGALRDTGAPIDIQTKLDASAGALSVKAIPAQHERILADDLPQNYGYLVNDSVLHPGDSFASVLADAGAQTLLLPVTAPWATELDVLGFAREAGPSTIIPIHDGYVKDFFKESRYKNFAAYFEREGMRFVPLTEPGDSARV